MKAPKGRQSTEVDEGEAARAAMTDPELWGANEPRKSETAAIRDSGHPRQRPSETAAIRDSGHM